MWTDNETNTDLIGFRVHADLIRDLVTDDTMLPVVLGVFGDWGGGKSSIMQMLQDDFKDKKYKDVLCLYFNGWMFESYEDAKTALLTSILMQLGENKKFGGKAKEQIVRLLKKVNYMEVLKMGSGAGLKYAIPLLITYLSGGTFPAIVPAMAASLLKGKQGKEAPAIDTDDGESSETDGEEKDKKEVSKDAFNWSKLIKESKDKPDLLEIRKFREDFAKMLKTTKIKSLVILIDDLDRCLPERVIETLEAIKLFVLVPRTAFVIGADRRIVEHAIGTRYAKYQINNDKPSEEVDHLIKDYLEKLIQIPYHLPRLSPAEIETYINLLACQKFLSEEDNKCVLDDWAFKRKQNVYSAYHTGAVKEALAGKELVEELTQQLSWSSSISQVVAEGLKGNPRQVKRMLNALLLRRKLANVAGIQIRDDVLAKIMVLEYAKEEQFLQLNDWQASEDGKPKALKKLEENALNIEGAEPISQEDNLGKWQTPAVLKWLQMQPSLRDVDLRDYFWLMRDRTSSTLAGVRMVSPHVGRLLRDLTEGNEGEQEVASSGVAGLDEPDRETLLDLLKQWVVQHPEEGKGYTAFRKLALKSVPEAVQTLIRTLREVPVELIPPEVANYMRMMGKADSNLEGDIRAALEFYSQNHSETMFGKSAASALER